MARTPSGHWAAARMLGRIRAEAVSPRTQRSMRRRTQVKNVKKAVLAVLTVGVLVGSVAGVALAGHNNPNLETTGHPGYAPDYYYPMTTAQSGPTQGIRRDV